ncbi:MAG: hypothetical protein B5766_10060 [Candidatus Lumbricidophila eiseniae]|uniref:Uncharacterized protein n=1 Tax=Candidatus Lumbricidiphila eiseniae TaxID=1969409 RepID=A0A2A6FP51_9MICO|nr:MAG: hypothetical protein B5766_10060 [Candidatus Lumbricidophila eiseniae]
MTAPVVAKKTRREPLVQMTFVTVALFTAWHIFASFLWISPVTPLRDIIPAKGLLTSYMIPWFGQSWSVFAPEPINGNYIFRVRATVKDASGNEQITKWVDATLAEFAMAEYNLFPPRGANLAIHQASLLFGAYGALTDEQKKFTGQDFFTGDVWLGDLYDKMGGQSSATATDYIVQERYTDAYATQVSLALWGGKDVTVTKVQYDVGRQNVIPFDKRDDPNAKPEPYQPVITGWRGTIVMPEQSQSDFADTFVWAFNKSGQTK